VSAEDEPRKRSLMTLRVYTATRDGIVTEERATVHVLAGKPTDVHALTQTWPPCACPRHRNR
jgi:hypothetical protein